MDQDLVSRAYASLAALRDEVEHFRPEGEVRDAYVNQYHDQLIRLEQIGYELSEFKIRPDELEQQSYTSNYITGETRQARYRTVEFGIFMSRLTALLTYFTLPGDRSIGFRPPK